jgi:hypothetical protein
MRDCEVRAAFLKIIFYSYFNMLVDNFAERRKIAPSGPLSIKHLPVAKKLRRLLP